MYFDFGSGHAVVSLESFTLFSWESRSLKALGRKKKVHSKI